MQTSNVVLKKMGAENVNRYGELMSIEGVINKGFFLLTLVIVAAAVSWIVASRVPGLGVLSIIGGSVLGLVLAIIISFVQRLAPILAPFYALAEGVALGALSQVFNQAYPGIALQAFGATIAVFVVMFAMYRMRIVRVNQRFRAVIMGAILGILVFYLVTLVAGFFVDVSFLFSGALGIAISAFIVVIASFSLMLDFDMIEQGIAAGAPEDMEWYAAFGLMVTIIWIYVEILRLFAIIRGRD